MPGPSASPSPDLIDILAGIAPGTPLDAIRARRADARRHAQASHEALFGPQAGGAVPLADRLAVAAVVTAWHGPGPVAAAFEARLRAVDPQRADAVLREVSKGVSTGPFGHYPEGPLSPEDKAGVVYEPDVQARAALGLPLSAALTHAHLLLFRPRDASPAAIQALFDAGWSKDAVVTLSQIVAFLSFQVRVVAGLSLLVPR